MSKYENRSTVERMKKSLEMTSNKEEVLYRAAKIPDGSPTGSIKHDSDKPALQYVPGQAMEAMGKAFAYGAAKYGGNNYKISGLEVSRCLGAALRHIYKFNDGTDNDEESGHNHLGHAMAALAMALYMMDAHPIKDDRFKK